MWDAVAGIVAGSIVLVLISKIADALSSGEFTTVQLVGAAAEILILTLLLMHKTRVRGVAGIFLFALGSLAYHALAGHECRCVGILTRLGDNTEVMYASCHGLVGCLLLRKHPTIAAAAVRA